MLEHQPHDQHQPPTSFGFIDTNWMRKIGNRRLLAMYEDSIGFPVMRSRIRRELDYRREKGKLKDE